MRSEEDFCEAIFAEPDEDLPRLVFADWLEEQGNPRGEFIRLQCQLQDPTLPPAVREEWTFRSQQLLDDYRSEWLGEEFRFAVRLRFERGFPVFAEINAHVLLAHAEQLFRAAPLLRGLRLDEVHPVLGELLHLPQLLQIRHLDLSWNHLRPEGAETLLGGARQRRWQQTLRAWFGERSTATKIGGSEATSALQNVERLHLGSNSLGDAGVGYLAATPALAALRTLDLSDNAISDLGAQRLAECRHWQHLVQLNLASNEIQELGASSLSQAVWRSGMKILHVGYNRLRDVGVSALVASRWPELESLALQANQIQRPGAESLMHLAQLPSLRDLDLRHNGIPDETVLRFCRHPGFSRLHRLAIMGNPLSGPVWHTFQEHFPARPALPFWGALHRRHSGPTAQGVWAHFSGGSSKFPSDD